MMQAEEVKNMNIKHLSYVVEICRCGSINKAAQKLFLSQSGISTAVRELENELGIRVLARSNRGVEFTPEGNVDLDRFQWSGE